MKNIFIKYLAVAFLLMSVTACEDFLDEEVQGILPDEEYYQTEEDAMMAVIGIYDMMSAHYNGAWSSLYLVKTMPSDESNAGGSNDGDQKGYQDLDDFNIDSQNDKVGATWSTIYQAILRANNVVNNTEPESELQTRSIAEAKALRAMNYFDLVRLWGDVPLVLTNVNPDDFTSVGRAPASAVYEQIEKDLVEAIPNLPLKSQYTIQDKFRVSKGTAQALLGKVYLYQQNWSDAVTQFENVITSEEYDLENSVADVFSKAGEFGQESLFELSYTSGENYDWGNFPWGEKPESNIHVQLMGPRSDYYTMAPGDSLIGGWGFNVPTDKMYQAFVDAGDVNRRIVSMMSEEELENAGGNWSVDNAWDFEGYWQRKYGTFRPNTDEPILELNYGTNWRLIRYADVLLMAAEAHYRDGNEPQALTYLNEVRQRPGTNLPEVSATGSELFDAIVLERQLELAFEGHRYMDLVRWGLANQELGPLGFTSGKNEILPIPINEIRTAGLEQNPLY